MKRWRSRASIGRAEIALLEFCEYFALFAELAGGGRDDVLTVDVNLLTRGDGPLDVVFADEVVDVPVRLSGGWRCGGRSRSRRTRLTGRRPLACGLRLRGRRRRLWRRR